MKETLFVTMEICTVVDGRKENVTDKVLIHGQQVENILVNGKINKKDMVLNRGRMEDVIMVLGLMVRKRDRDPMYGQMDKPLPAHGKKVKETAMGYMCGRVIGKDKSIVVDGEIINITDTELYITKVERRGRGIGLIITKGKKVERN